MENKENKSINIEFDTNFEIEDKVVKIEPDVLEETTNYSSEDEISLSLLKRSKEYETEVKPEIKNIDETFKCLMCFEIQDNQINLLKHYNKEHMKIPDEKIEVKYVTKSVNDTILYECCICDKKYNNKKGIKRHFFGHINARPFICKMCGK